MSRWMCDLIEIHLSRLANSDSKVHIVTSNAKYVGKIKEYNDYTVILQTEIEVLSIPDNYVMSGEVAISRQHIEAIGEWKR